MTSAWSAWSSGWSTTSHQRPSAPTSRSSCRSRWRSTGCAFTTGSSSCGNRAPEPLLAWWPLSAATADQIGDSRARTLAAAPPAVTLTNVSKTFQLPHQRYSTLKERVLHPMRSRTFDELKAVQDINLTVPRGEFFGIVGRNGSGKSTLLKCIADIYRPDAGTVEIEGRLSPFIELGVGF